MISLIEPAYNELLFFKNPFSVEGIVLEHPIFYTLQVTHPSMAHKFFRILPLRQVPQVPQKPT